MNQKTNDEAYTMRWKGLEKKSRLSKQYNKYIKYIYIQASSYFFSIINFSLCLKHNLIFIIYFKNSDLLNMLDLSLVWPKHVLYKIGTFPVVNGKTSISFIFFFLFDVNHFSFSVMYLILYSIYINPSFILTFNNTWIRRYRVFYLDKIKQFSKLYILKFVVCIRIKAMYWNDIKSFVWFQENKNRWESY